MYGESAIHGPSPGGLPENVSAAIANHHNALAILTDESSRNSQLKQNLLAILKNGPEHSLPRRTECWATRRRISNGTASGRWSSITWVVGLRLRKRSTNDSRTRRA